MGDGIETTRTAVADGVQVRRTIDTGPAETAVVTLDVAVERDDPTTVRITEPALGAVPRDEVELHTDHGAEYWQIGDEATFEREFDAGESYEVVYRVAGVDADRFDALDEDPVVAVDSSSIDDLVSRDDSDAVRDLIAGERESLVATPGAGGVELSFESAPDAAQPDPTDHDTATAVASSDGPADGPSSEEIPVDASPEEISVGGPSMDGSAETGEPATEPAVEAAGSVETDESPDPTGAASADDDLAASLAATPTGGVARVLLQELREGHVDEELREELREELNPGRSQDVRIKHLQSEVAEFAAYVEMLDGFVDEHGTIDDAVGGMDEQVSSLDDELGSVRSEVDELREGQGGLEARVERLEAELEAVDERLDEFGEFKERLSGVFQGVGDPQE